MAGRGCRPPRPARRPEGARPDQPGRSALSEADLRARLAAEGLDPGSWSNGPFDRYGAHDHPFDKVLVVARGSIVFGLPESQRKVALSDGDRLDLPAGTVHDALVGPVGVTCLEAHAPAGTLGAGMRVTPSGTW